MLAVALVSCSLAVIFHESKFTVTQFDEIVISNLYNVELTIVDSKVLSRSRSSLRPLTIWLELFRTRRRDPLKYFISEMHKDLLCVLRSMLNRPFCN